MRMRRLEVPVGDRAAPEAEQQQGQELRPVAMPSAVPLPWVNSRTSQSCATRCIQVAAVGDHLASREEPVVARCPASETSAAVTVPDGAAEARRQHRSGLAELLQDRRGGPQRRPLLRGSARPAVSPATRPCARPGLDHQVPARRCHGEHHLTFVRGVRRPRDESILLQRGDNARHGGRLHLFRTRPTPLGSSGRASPVSPARRTGCRTARAPRSPARSVRPAAAEPACPPKSGDCWPGRRPTGLC